MHYKVSGSVCLSFLIVTLSHVALSNKNHNTVTTYAGIKHIFIYKAVDTFCWRPKNSAVNVRVFLLNFSSKEINASQLLVTSSIVVTKL